MKKFHVFLIFVFVVFSCSTTRTMENYNALTSTEHQIIDVVLQLKDAYNSHNLEWSQQVEKIVAAYSPKASIQTGVDGNLYEGVIVNREEFRNICMTKTAYREYRIMWEFHEPKNLKLEGDKASFSFGYRFEATVPFKTRSGRDVYGWEVGIYHLELIREDGTWLINKHRWETIDTNNPKFKEYKKTKK